MKVISLNIGKPQPISYHGGEVVTAIYKSPVEGKKSVFATNIEGDAQGDLSVHGGALKAVYAYDVAYYEQWKKLLRRDDWTYGLFGENLTTEGLTDEVVFIGNIYQIGSAILQAVQPRFPCYKLNIRFERDDMLQLFIKEAKHGTYFRVLKEGTLAAGDPIKLVERSVCGVTIQQLAKAYFKTEPDEQLIRQILAIDFLPERLRKVFEGKISNDH